MLEVLTGRPPALQMPDGHIEYQFTNLQKASPEQVTDLLKRMLDRRAQWPADLAMEVGKFALLCIHPQERQRPIFVNIVKQLRLWTQRFITRRLSAAGEGDGSHSSTAQGRGAPPQQTAAATQQAEQQAQQLRLARQQVAEKEHQQQQLFEKTRREREEAMRREREHEQIIEQQKQRLREREAALALQEQEQALRLEQQQRWLLEQQEQQQLLLQQQLQAEFQQRETEQRRRADLTLQRAG